MTLPEHLSQIQFDQNGLIPAIIQDCKTNKVLMLGYMNQEAFLKTLKGPFPEIKFIPTGGVNINNFSEILSHENVFAVAGSFMFPKNKNKSLDLKKTKKIINQL